MRRHWSGADVKTPSMERQICPVRLALGIDRPIRLEHQPAVPQGLGHGLAGDPGRLGELITGKRHRGRVNLTLRPTEAPPFMRGYSRAVITTHKITHHTVLSDGKTPWFHGVPRGCAHPRGSQSTKIVGAGASGKSGLLCPRRALARAGRIRQRRYSEPFGRSAHPNVTNHTLGPWFGGLATLKPAVAVSGCRGTRRNSWGRRGSCQNPVADGESHRALRV
jgi:hypothetical protein